MKINLFYKFPFFMLFLSYFMTFILLGKLIINYFSISILITEISIVNITFNYALLIICQNVIFPVYLIHYFRFNHLNVFKINKNFGQWQNLFQVLFNFL